MGRLRGPVLSHATEDRDFVRRLDRAILEAGFETWLDERRLLPGDDLGGEISNALTDAGAFLVVSSASVDSSWLRYELRLAVPRMVRGELRIIPIRLESVEMPSELRSLVYADFTKDFATGWEVVRTALEQEASAFEEEEIETHLDRIADHLLGAIFDGTHFVSVSSEYLTDDYSAVGLQLPDDRQLVIPYDTIEDYGNDPSPLTNRWWDEFLEAAISNQKRYTLLITRRPNQRDDPALAGTSERVRVSYDRSPDAD